MPNESKPHKCIRFFSPTPHLTQNSGPLTIYCVFIQFNCQLYVFFSDSDWFLGGIMWLAATYKDGSSSEFPRRDLSESASCSLGGLAQCK